jgi:hypothetical protein
MNATTATTNGQRQLTLSRKVEANSQLEESELSPKGNSEKSGVNLPIR